MTPADLYHTLAAQVSHTGQLAGDSSLAHRGDSDADWHKTFAALSNARLMTSEYNAAVAAFFAYKETT